MFSSSPLYSFRKTSTFRDSVFNTFKKWVSCISSKIYLKDVRYQCYKTTDINNAKICDDRLQGSRGYFPDCCTWIAQ